MTQQDVTSRNDYVGNSSTTEFVYTFKILDRTHIQVVLIEDVTQIESIQIIDTDYDVSGLLDDGGGTVTFFTAPDTGFSIILKREVPFNQESEFVEGTPFPAETIETNYDKLTQIAQELRNTQRTALKPPLLPNFIDGTLKPDTNTEINAGDILQINSTVDGFVVNPASVVFDIEGLSAHQLVQLGNISETTFISTAEWDFLGNMNQGVSTTDDVTFNSVNGALNLSEIGLLSKDEIEQLENIDSNIISNSTWSNMASMDQDVDMSASPEFAGLTIGGEPVGASTIHLNQNLASGSIEDGILSIPSQTTFSITAGSGIIVDYSTDVLDPVVTEVSWSAFIGVTLLNMGTGSFKSIAIDINGDIVQINDGFTELQLRDLISIGSISHDATNIFGQIDAARKAIGRTDVVTDMTTAVGILNVSGNIFSPNGANLNIDKTSGSTFGLSLNSEHSQKFANMTTDASGVLISMTPIFRDGAGGFTVGAFITDIDVANYDDGSGTLQSLGVNQATNHRLAFLPAIDQYFFLYGQTLYANLSSAVAAGVDPFVTLDASNKEVSVRTVVSARGGATDLSNLSDAVFLQISKFGTTAGPTTSIQAATLQTAYDQSESIVLAAATPLSVQVDTDTDTAASYKDSSSTETYAIDGGGNVNQSGTLTLNGVTNDLAPQLIVQANVSQDTAEAIASFRDSSSNEFFKILDGRTEITGFDDDAIPVNIVGSPSPNDFLFRIQNNALDNLFSVDNNGQVLSNGVEFESGPGEVVIAYQEFSVLDPIPELGFPVVAFDDPNIIGYRIEIRNIRSSKLGNDPGTTPAFISIRFSTNAGSSFKNQSGNYKYLINSERPEDFTGLSEVQNGFYVSTVRNVTPVPSLVLSTTATVEIPSMTEFLEDKPMIKCEGWQLNQEASVNKLLAFKNSGHFDVADASEEGESIDAIRIACSVNQTTGNTASDGTGFTAGSIKVVGIKKGGPAFTIFP